MKIKKYINFINEQWKSDEDISAEFEDFTIEQFDFETRNKDYMYSPNTFEGTVFWNFPSGDESVGGGAETTTEDFVYNIDNGSFKYVCNNWYPAKTYEQMVNMIKTKLSEKYGKKFTHYKDIEFIRLNEK